MSVLERVLPGALLRTLLPGFQAGFSISVVSVCSLDPVFEGDQVTARVLSFAGEIGDDSMKRLWRPC